MPVIKNTMLGGALAAMLCVASPASADPNFVVEPVTQGALPGSLIHNPMAIRWDPQGGNKTVKIVESEGVPGGQAISFRVRKKSKKPWDIMMRAPFDKSVSQGEAIEIYFWARAAKTPKGRDAGKITVALGRNEEPYDTVIVQDIEPTETWQMFKVSGVAERDFPTSESDMGFNFGHAKQTIELGPFYAVTLGASN